MSVKIQKPKLLIVEGRDEQFCFEAAPRDHLDLTDIQVMPIGGKTPLTRNLTGLIADLDFATVGFLAVVGVPPVAVAEDDERN